MSTRPQRSVVAVNYAELAGEDSELETPTKKLDKPKVHKEPLSARIAAQRLIDEHDKPKHWPSRPVLPTHKRFFRKDPIKAKPPLRRQPAVKEEPVPVPDQADNIDVKPSTSAANINTPAAPAAPKGTFKTTQQSLKKHKEERYFKCPNCRIHKSSVMKLNDHYKRRHPVLKCNKCTMTFTTPSGPSCHQYAHAAPRYPCTDYDKSFFFSSELKVHRSTHLKIKAHVCNQGNCNSSFMNKPDLLKHVWEHDAEPLHCDSCDYSTKNPRLLKSHAAVHSNEKPHKCEHCGEAYRYQMQVQRHN